MDDEELPGITVASLAATANLSFGLGDDSKPTGKRLDQRLLERPGESHTGKPVDNAEPMLVGVNLLQGRGADPGLGENIAGAMDRRSPARARRETSESSSSGGCAAGDDDDRFVTAFACGS